MASIWHTLYNILICKKMVLIKLTMVCCMKYKIFVAYENTNRCGLNKTGIFNPEKIAKNCVLPLQVKNIICISLS